MALDPSCEVVLKAFAALGPLPWEYEDAAEGRAASIRNQPVIDAPHPVAKVENRTIDGPEGAIPVRIYWPPVDTRPLPVVVYFHGGGWVIGNLDSHDQTVRRITIDTEAIFVSVDYRLAPEHKFPAAAEDCYAATAWAAKHAAELGGDAARLAVAGDSAGGNLAAAVSLMSRDRGGPAIRFQLLVYPVTGAPDDGHASYRENASGYLLTAESMHWFTNHYKRTDADLSNPYFAPMRAENLSGLPPALVLTAEFDPLRDEGEAYGHRLAEAGVPTTIKRYDGLIHGFFGMDAIVPRARDAQLQAASMLRDALA